MLTYVQGVLGETERLLSLRWVLEIGSFSAKISHVFPTPPH